MRRSFRCLLLGIALCGGAAAASAQNLLQNGTFDTTVAPWSSFRPIVEFSTLDANGNAASGSLRGTNSNPGLFSAEGIDSECIPVVGGAAYEVSYDYLIVPAAGLTPEVFVQVLWSSDTACTTNFSGEAGSLGDIADGAWHANPDPGSLVHAPAEARSARVSLIIRRQEAAGSVTANFDNVVFKAAGTCALGPEVLCLSGDRFQIEANWRTATGSGRAQMFRLTSDTGYLWFFSPENVEVVIKILNACNPFGRFWVFAGGLTDVEVDITVTDTQTGAFKIYHNNLGEPFAPLQDTSAFSACP